MSLDVYLESPTPPVPQVKGDRIFIRRDGRRVELTREQWDACFPGRDPVTVITDEESHTLFTANITHNLGGMANEAGIYKAMWRPEEIGIERAEQLVAILADGLTTLRANPERFKRLNPENGWGSYETLVGFVEEYLEACRKHPAATIRTWR